MRIHTDFVGGCVEVKAHGETYALLGIDNRDSMIQWFYWAFCVEGAGGQTVEFHFDKDFVGYYGAAVSHDLENWEFTNTKCGTGFTYTFAPNENKVYFAHHMLYHPNRFLRFANKLGLEVKELCKSRKLRSVPLVEFGDENGKQIVLTSRHHGCESTGDYVLEGVVESLFNAKLKGYRVICIPFMDYDGVVDGDQSKGRFPMGDYNRDYDKEKEPLYNETAKVRELFDEKTPIAAFDFHSPWHCGGRNDFIFLVHPHPDAEERINAFGKILEKNIDEKSMKYEQKNDIPPDFEWNKSSAKTCSRYVVTRKDCLLSFTTETTYFGESDNIFNGEKAVNFGKCFGKSVVEFLKKYDK